MVPKVQFQVKWESLLQKLELFFFVAQIKSGFKWERRMSCQYKLFFLIFWVGLRVSASLLRTFCLWNRHLQVLHKLAPSSKFQRVICFGLSRWKFCSTLLRKISLPLYAWKCSESGTTRGYSTQVQRMVQFLDFWRTVAVAISQSHTGGIVEMIEN